MPGFEVCRNLWHGKISTMKNARASARSTCSRSLLGSYASCCRTGEPKRCGTDFGYRSRPVTTRSRSFGFTVGFESLQARQLHSLIYIVLVKAFPLLVPSLFRVLNSSASLLETRAFVGMRIDKNPRKLWQRNLRPVCNSIVVL